MTPHYLLAKLARHGATVERLCNEREMEKGEFAEMSDCDAIAFEAADLVWAYLVLRKHPEAQETRQLRNHVAESIIAALNAYDWLSNKDYKNEDRE